MPVILPARYEGHEEISTVAATSEYDHLTHMVTRFGISLLWNVARGVAKLMPLCVSEQRVVRYDTCTAAFKSLLTVLQQKPWSERCAQCKWR